MSKRVELISNVTGYFGSEGNKSETFENCRIFWLIKLGYFKCNTRCLNIIANFPNCQEINFISVHSYILTF